MLQGFELGWAVAILEGEGCFGIYWDKRRPDTCSVKIQMESTDYDVVIKLDGLVPGRVWESNYPSKTKAFPNAKPSWRWAISDKKKVKELCELIYPFMSERRKSKIDEILKNCYYRKETN